MCPDESNITVTFLVLKYIWWGLLEMGPNTVRDVAYKSIELLYLLILIFLLIIFMIINS